MSTLALTAGVVAVVNLAAPQFDCSILEVETFDEAAPLAHGCDADVEVLSERTPWQTSYAVADGGALLEVSTLPSRVKVDGKWIAPDSTIEQDPKTDVISVAAPVFPIELNAGGKAGMGKPLGTVERDGQSFAVWFPLELPAPQIEGSQAFYQLADGVRLVVSVNVDATGFLPVVELADAKAAATFKGLLAVADAAKGLETGGGVIHFATEASEGLRLVVDEMDAVHVVDANDETQFFAPSPMMWDSAGEPLPVTDTATEVGVADRTQAPGDGDRVEMMDVEIVDSTIAVSPDAGMLADPETVWPVYIDPGFGGYSASLWIKLRTGGYTNTVSGWTNVSSSSPGEGSGRCNDVSCTTTFTQRLAWQYSGLSIFGPLVSSDITSAYFDVNGTHSYNCTSQRMNLWHALPFASNTSWGGNAVGEQCQLSDGSSTFRLRGWRSRLPGLRCHLDCAVGRHYGQHDRCNGTHRCH